MESLTLEQAYFVSQILAGVAVVLSLVYVGLQLNQNIRAMKLAGIINMIETLRDATANLSQSDEKSELFFTVISNPGNLTGSQKQRSYIIFQNLISAFELAHFQQSEGALEERHWSG